MVWVGITVKGGVAAGLQGDIRRSWIDGIDGETALLPNNSSDRQIVSGSFKNHGSSSSGLIMAH